VELGRDFVAAATAAARGGGGGGGQRGGGGGGGACTDGGEEEIKLKNPLRSDLEVAVEAIVAEDPASGVKYVVKSLKDRHPTWLVGEGRVRPILSKMKAKREADLPPPVTLSHPGISWANADTHADTHILTQTEVFVAGTRSDPRQVVKGRSALPIAAALGECMKREYSSRASVFIMGMGADEQMCGYSRYRSKLRVGGESAVLADMAKDMARIWYRNLGRDDRCISDHAREARFPFLDENVVKLISGMELSTIADLSQPPGVGDKLVLRQVAQRVGISGAAKQVKRAIQFGTRIAKQSNIQTFGSNRKASGETRLLP